MFVFWNSAGKSPKDSVNSLSTKLSVNEEYLQAFRTKSYVEMWDRVQGQLGTASSSSRISPSLSFPSYLDLSEYLLEPRQETLKNIIQSLNFHHLLTDYFGASLQACNICELLLKSIYRTRLAYKKIKMVIKMMTQKMHDRAECFTQDNYGAIFRELKAFALLKNPLSIITPVQFRDFHDNNLVLLQRITSTIKKIKRREKLRRICKKAGGVGLVVSNTALLIALLVLAFHSILGIAAAPALIGCALAPRIGRRKRMERARESGRRRRLHGGAGEQLDVAARGLFILIKDFDTISRMARRLYDEVEHRKYVAGMCVRIRKCELLAEVVRDFDAQERSFVEQLEELEEHIYLCLLTINRSRGLVIRQIMENQY